MNIAVMPKDREQLEWIRQFAEQNYRLFAPSTLQVRQALASHLPEQLLQYFVNAEAEELLEEVLGIAVVIKLGEWKIALSMTGDKVEATALQQKYNTAAYNAIRADLGIDSHWILLVNLELLFTGQNLYEAHMDLMELDSLPECAVVPV